MREFNPLLSVCDLLNKHRVKYIIAGAFACILHGLVRTTEDVDILISPDPENCQKVSQCFYSEMSIVLLPS